LNGVGLFPYYWGKEGDPRITTASKRFEGSTAAEQRRRPEDETLYRHWFNVDNRESGGSDSDFVVDLDAVEGITGNTLLSSSRSANHFHHQLHQLHQPSNFLSPPLPPSSHPRPSFSSQLPYPESINTNIGDFNHLDEEDVGRRTEIQFDEAELNPWQPQTTIGTAQDFSYSSAAGPTYHHTRNVPSASTSSRPTTPRRPARTNKLWNPQNYSPRHPSPSGAKNRAYSLSQALPPVPGIPVAYLGQRPHTGDDDSLLSPLEQRQNRESLNSLASPAGATSLVVHDTSSGLLNRSLHTVGLPPHLQFHPNPPERGDSETQQRLVIAQAGNIQVMVHDNRSEQPFPVRRGSSNDLETGDGNGRLKRTPSKITLPAAFGDQRPSTADEHNAEFDAGQFEWGPEHPCFPHSNPHVPLDSPLYASTRVIRVPRDWLIAGDLAPTFANVYPQVLEPFMAEAEFRNVVGYINDEVLSAFNPFGWRSWLDSALGVLTLWLWDDWGLTGVKSKLRRLEEWIERWNRDVGEREGVRIVPLRRTAYMTVCSFHSFAQKGLLTWRTARYTDPGPADFTRTNRSAADTELKAWHWHQSTSTGNIVVGTHSAASCFHMTSFTSHPFPVSPHFFLSCIYSSGVWLCL
jgi:hypothetical protein